MKLDTVSYKLCTVNQIKVFQEMKPLLEIERIATTNGKRSRRAPLRGAPFTPIEPRRERRRREREQLRQAKRTADGSGIQSSKRRKDFDSFGG